VGREVALQLLGGPVHRARQLAVAPRVAGQGGAGPDQCPERPLVLPVLADHGLELGVDGPVAAPQPRGDGLLLVARVERQRQGEVALDAEGGVGHRVGCGAAGPAQAARQGEEGADAAVALEEQVDGVGGRGGPSQSGQHGLSPWARAA
jgi:hypothetical protein